MTDQPQRHRRWVLASRPMVNRRQRISRPEESEVPTPARVKCCCVPFIYRSTRICAGA